MSIDRMDWHYDGDYPNNLPKENSGTHIGIYLAWIIMNNLESKELQESSKLAIQKVRERKITGRDFLISECDEKFWDSDLNEDGIRFTKFYYENTVDQNKSKKSYFEDYETILGKQYDTLYEIKDSWENYDLMANIIDIRYREYKIQSDE